MDAASWAYCRSSVEVRMELDILLWHDEGVAPDATRTTLAGGAVAGERWKGGERFVGDVYLVININ